MENELDMKKLAREEALKDVKMYMASGWEIKEETPQAFILRRNEASTTGHVLIFLFFGWWTIGFANLIYWLAKRKTKLIMK